MLVGAKPRDSTAFFTIHHESYFLGSHNSSMNVQYKKSEISWFNLKPISLQLAGRWLM
jgi:hypothetical protein